MATIYDWLDEAKIAKTQRNMTPEEQRRLWSEKGIEQRVLPTTPVDLVENNPLFDYLGEVASTAASKFSESPLAQTMLPAALMGMVRYKKPGVSAAARETAEHYHGKPVDDRLARRDLEFHATMPTAVEPILRSREIVPEPHLMQRFGAGNWDEFTQMAAERPSINIHGNYNPDVRGTSVSRVPRVSSKGTMAVSFALDPNKMPPTRPFAEPGFKKTEYNEPLIKPLWDEYGKATKRVDHAFKTGDIDVINEAGRAADEAFRRWQDAMPYAYGPNEKFEFENRTFDKAIPREAIKEIWADKAALADTLRYTETTMEDYLDQLRRLAGEHGLPIREFETGREMHGARARIK